MLYEYYILPSVLSTIQFSLKTPLAISRLLLHLLQPGVYNEVGYRTRKQSHQISQITANNNSCLLLLFTMFNMCVRPQSSMVRPRLSAGKTFTRQHTCDVTVYRFSPVSCLTSFGFTMLVCFASNLHNSNV